MENEKIVLDFVDGMTIGINKNIDDKEILISICMLVSFYVLNKVIPILIK